MRREGCLCTQKLCILYKYTWNTPSIYSNWARQPLKTRPQKRGVCEPAGIHYTPVKSVDNDWTAKHEPAMFVRLMLPGSFFPPFFFLIFPSIGESLKARADMFKNTVCGGKKPRITISVLRWAGIQRTWGEKHRDNTWLWKSDDHSNMLNLCLCAPKALMPNFQRASCWVCLLLFRYIKTFHYVQTSETACGIC